MLDCFTGDTKVHTNKGDICFVDLYQDFYKGKVYTTKAFDFKGNKTDSYRSPANLEVKTDKIIDVFISGIKRVYKITLDGKSTIKCTPGHKFLMSDLTWKSIDSGLSPGDEFYNKMKSQSRDTSVHPTGYTGRVSLIEYIGVDIVYNLTTEKYHNYLLSNNIIVDDAGYHLCQ